MVTAREAWFETVGGPEVIQWRETELAAPGPGEVLVRTTAVGLNFIDTYYRRGIYPADLPGRLGQEAAGVVEETLGQVRAWMAEVAAREVQTAQIVWIARRELVDLGERRIGRVFLGETVTP